MKYKAGIASWLPRMQTKMPKTVGTNKVHKGYVAVPYPLRSNQCFQGPRWYRRTEDDERYARVHAILMDHKKKNYYFVH